MRSALLHPFHVNSCHFVQVSQENKRFYHHCLLKCLGRQNSIVLRKKVRLSRRLQWKIATTCCRKIIIMVATVRLQFDWLRATFSLMGLSNGAAVGSARHLHLGSGGMMDQSIAKLWQIDIVSNDWKVLRRDDSFICATTGCGLGS